MIELLHINKNRFIRTFNKISNKRSIKSCWNFTGCYDRPGYGYGRVKINGKHKKAHRIVYELFKGKIPPNKVIMHLCDNRKCCNPHHLSIGTQKENIADCIKKGRFKGIININRNKRNIS